nr:PREDICTED: uncharacterized protein LOC109033125 [Bemisia tabaci]
MIHIAILTMSVSLIMLGNLVQPSDSRRFGFFIRDPSACQKRCDRKEGYFEDSPGDLVSVAIGKVWGKGVKCFCRTNERFSMAILRETKKQHPMPLQLVPYDKKAEYLAARQRANN